jgi:pimeloyl-ACP methyl ester carboxylesterase
MDESRKPRRLWWLKRLLRGLAILILVLLVAGFVYQTGTNFLAARANPPPGQLVEVGGHRIHIVCTGEGSPTVILETGLGDNSTIWALVQPALAQTTQVCAYDRAGLGWSDDGPRDSATIVQELKALLTNAAIAPPYVLAGHSIAGLHSRLYAHTYPEEVAGMVLIDASHEEQLERLPVELMAMAKQEKMILTVCRIIAPLGIVRLMGVFDHSALPRDVQPAADMLSYQNRLCRSIVQESDAVEASAAQLAGAESLDDMPLVVLTAGQLPSLNDLPPGATPELVQEMHAVWQELQAEHAARSGNSSHIIAEKSGHYIHIDQPQLVITLNRLQPLKERIVV